MSRFTKDLIEIVELIAATGSNLRSLKETWLDTTTAHGKLMFTMFAGLAQFKRDIISVRMKEGLAVAAAHGRVGGRRETSEHKVEYAFHLYDKGGMTTQQIADEVGIIYAISLSGPSPNAAMLLLGVICFTSGPTFGTSECGCTRSP